MTGCGRSQKRTMDVVSAVFFIILTLNPSQAQNFGRKPANILVVGDDKRSGTSSFIQVAERVEQQAQNSNTAEQTQSLQTEVNHHLSQQTHESAAVAQTETANTAVRATSKSQSTLQSMSKLSLCKTLMDNWATVKMMQPEATADHACEKESDLAKKAECKDMANLMQVMMKNGDMIPIIEKMRRMRRDLERIEKEMEEERRKKQNYDKTKAQLIVVIDKLTEQIKKCTNGCKQWCNEMILVLLTKLKLSQQRLVKCRIDLEKCREKIALLIIEIQHLKAIIQKMVQAILWLYNKLTMLLAVIARLKAWIFKMIEEVCTKFTRVFDEIKDKLNRASEEFGKTCKEPFPPDYGPNYLADISREAMEFEWTSFDKSLAMMTWQVGG
eukprot:GILJ01004523.1.p1 GENE.GILJ01004523.1~~GILJ01004523.1.p1  ORF type:complete len:384 (+),score=68.22 GILJ01004523.1:88-1239(+)